MTKADNYVAVMLEEIRDQNKVIVEAVGQMQDTIKTLATQESLDKLAARVDVIEIVVKETNKDVKDLKKRVTHLELVVL